MSPQSAHKKFMLGEELPSEILREVFYLDAYTTMLNNINYRSLDKNDWSLEDYISDLFEDVIESTQCERDLLTTIKNGSLDYVPTSSLFPAIVVTAIKRHEVNEPKDKDLTTDPKISE